MSDLINPTPREQFFSLSLDMLCVAGSDGYFKDLNSAWELNLGYSIDELLSKPYIEFVHPEDRRETLAVAGGLTEGKQVISFENRYLHQNGTYRWLLWKAAPSADGKTVYAIARDVTEHKLLTEGVQDFAIFMLDPKGRIISWNKGAELLYGHGTEDVVGRHVGNIYAQPDMLAGRPTEHLEEAVKRGKFAAEGWQLRKDGSKFWGLVATAVLRAGGEQIVGFSRIVQDMSARKRLEEQLTQSQKMEAIGRLAGGIAHDFNNALTAIMGYSDMVLSRLAEAEPLREDIIEIRRAGERATSLTRQLLAFSRRQVLQPKIISLNGVVADVEKMLRRLIGEDIELRTLLAPDLWTVLADPGQIEQIIINLAVNARDAMPKGGKLTLETGNINLDESYAIQHPGARAGNHVMLAVTDNGIGMDQAVQSRLFEPFFTTKEIGKGTGLGLSTVYGIVKQSGGNIWVYSEPGKGTTFKLYFPRVDGMPQPVKMRPTTIMGPRGRETILVVEDDFALRILAEKILRGNGYRVFLASGGKEAIDLCKEHQGSIDLLLADVVMPEMGGRELYEVLSRSRPEMKVLFMSGYTDDAIAHHGILAPGAAYLEKPFSPSTLSLKIRETLDSSES